MGKIMSVIIFHEPFTIKIYGSFLSLIRKKLTMGRLPCIGANMFAK